MTVRATSLSNVPCDRLSVNTITMHFITILTTFLFTDFNIFDLKILVEATFGQCVALQIFFIGIKATRTAWSNNLCGLYYTKGLN